MLSKIALAKKHSSCICEWLGEGGWQGGGQTTTSNHPLFRFKFLIPVRPFVYVYLSRSNPAPPCYHIACLIICLPITHEQTLPPLPGLCNKALSSITDENRRVFFFFFFFPNTSFRKQMIKLITQESQTWS